VRTTKDISDVINKEIVDDLTKLGLTNLESKIFCFLLTRGDKKPIEISKELKINPPLVYRVLNKLMEKELVILGNERPRIYRALPLSIATSILLRNKESEFYNAITLREKLLLKSLNKLPEHVIYDTNFSENDRYKRVFYINGRRATMEFIGNQIKKAKKEINAFVSTEGLYRMVYLHQKEYIEARDRGVEVRIIAPLPESLELISEINKWASLKGISSSGNARFIIFDDNLTMFLVQYGEHESKKGSYYVGISIKDQDISKMMKDFFLMLWKSIK
jgi:sugar-specific transcriptional regulator TrmB